MAEDKFMSEIRQLLPALGSMSEEEWRAHDARVAAAARQEAEAEERKARRERAAGLAEDGVPVKDLERVVAGPLEQTQPLALAQRALSGRWWLWALSGPAGVGKTTAAAWWLVQAHVTHELLRCERIRFVAAKRLQRWPQYDEARMRELERARALVIDDLGVEYDDDKGNWRALLDGLVDARYSAMLPTLLTTNLPRDAFKARYGERLADRLREGGGFVVATGPSMRVRQQPLPGVEER